MFTLELKSNGKVKLVKYAKMQEGNENSVEFWNKFHGDKPTDFSGILREHKIRGIVWWDSSLGEELQLT